MTLNTIINIKVVNRTRDLGWIHALEPGELLTMSDGSKWFHPYNGKPPIKLRGRTCD